MSRRRPRRNATNIAAGASPRLSGRAPSQRQLRMGEAMRQALADIITRESFADPLIADATFTISEVRPSPDLKQATVFVSVLGMDGHEEQLAIQALNAQKGPIRQALDQKITRKYSAALNFVRDALYDQAGHIDALLRSDKVQADISEADADFDVDDNDEDGHGA